MIQSTCVKYLSIYRHFYSQLNCLKDVLINLCYKQLRLLKITFHLDIDQKVACVKLFKVKCDLVLRSVLNKNNENNLLMKKGILLSIIIKRKSKP